MQTKSIFASKTFWLNAIAFVLVVLALPQFVSILPASAMPYIALLAAVGNTALRTFFPSAAPVSLLGGYKENPVGTKAK